MYSRQALFVFCFGAASCAPEARDTQAAPERQSSSAQGGATEATSSVLGRRIAQTAQEYAPPPATDGIRLIDKYHYADTSLMFGDWYGYEDDDTINLAAIVKGWKLYDGKASMHYATEVRDSAGALLWENTLPYKEAYRWSADSFKGISAAIPMSELPKRSIYYVHLSLTDLANGSVMKCVYTVRRREEL